MVFGYKKQSERESIHLFCINGVPETPSTETVKQYRKRYPNEAGVPNTSCTVGKNWCTME